MTDQKNPIDEAVDQIVGEFAAVQAKREVAAQEERTALDAKLEDIDARVKQLQDLEREGLRRNSLPGVEYDAKGDKPGQAFSLWRAMQLAHGQAKPHGPCGYTLTDKRFGYEREVAANKPEGYEQRTYNVGTDAAGGVFVPQEVMSDSIIPELDDVSVVRRAGATSITGLVGDVTWPADEGGFTAYYPDTEGEEDITESVNTFGSRTARPHTMAAMQKLSHKQMLQTNLEPFVRSTFVRKMALREDLSAIEGLGAAGQPLGLTNITGVTNSTVLDTIGAQGAVSAFSDFMYTIITQKAFDPAGRYAFIVTSDVAKEIQGAVDADGRPLFGSALAAPQGILNSIFGYPVFVSDQFNSGSQFAMFGDFSKLLLCNWNSLTIRATEEGDDAKKLRMSLIGYQDHDVVAVHPEAFVYSDSVDTDFNA